MTPLRSNSAEDVVLIIRHTHYKARLFEPVQAWIEEHASESAPVFKVCTLPASLDPRWNVRAVVFWLQDPVEDWSERTYGLAEALADFYTQRGVPVLNRPRNTSKSVKSVAAPLIASAGFRVPRLAVVSDFATFAEEPANVGFPFFVREDRGHGSAMLLAHTPAEARAIDIASFKHPLAVEFVDVADPVDGLFRKYRYFGCGDLGVPHHLQASTSWVARGEHRVLNDQTRAEELHYIGRPDPHHARFQAAMRALELDVAAFDYSYDRAGEVIVWEVNPFPFIQFGKTTTAFRNDAVHRTIAALVTLYLTRAGLPVPKGLERWLAFKG